VAATWVWQVRSLRPKQDRRNIAPSGLPSIRHPTPQPLRTLTLGTSPCEEEEGKPCELRCELRAALGRSVHTLGATRHFNTRGA